MYIQQKGHHLTSFPEQPFPRCPGLSEAVLLQVLTAPGASHCTVYHYVYDYIKS